MGRHALLSASASKRWLNCTPSARLETQFSDDKSPYAAEGTAAHALAEHKLKRSLKRRSKRPVSDYDCDEEGAFPESDDALGQVSISAYKVATMLKVSDELLNDSAFNLEAYISKEFGRRIGAKEEEAFFVGDGTGKPTGIFNATGGASNGTTTSAANIAFDDVMDLFYAVKSPYRKKAAWVLNDTTVKALRKLKDNNGNYIWQPLVQAGQEF